MSRNPEPPCIGLDPDTDPCPLCGAGLSEGCGWEMPVADDEPAQAPTPRKGDTPAGD